MSQYEGNGSPGANRSCHPLLEGGAGTTKVAFAGHYCLQRPRCCDGRPGCRYVAADRQASYEKAGFVNRTPDRNFLLLRVGTDQ